MITHLSLFLSVVVVHVILRVEIIVEKLLFDVTFFDLIAIPQATQLLLVFLFFLALSLFLNRSQELFSERLLLLMLDVRPAGSFTENRAIFKKIAKDFPMSFNFCICATNFLLFETINNFF
jgi:hypothetical protein